MYASGQLEIDNDFLQGRSVLYVEDEDEVREQTTRFLRRRFGQVEAAESGRRGLELFRELSFDVVITDVKMPELDGLDMAKAIKALSNATPVIVVTAYNETDYLMRAIEIGVDRYVKKPVDPRLLVEAVFKATQVHFQERELERLRKRALDSVVQVIEALARAIEVRDPYTDGHQKRVAQLAVNIGHELGFSEHQLTGLRLGSLIHDLGKIYVPASILSLPRRLDATEFALVKHHPEAGREILGDADFPWPISEIILQHHERLDGSGYPQGLKGDEIALEARIVAVADVVEAISSHRPYRPALGIEAALEEITRGRGTLFDAAIVDTCIDLYRRDNRGLLP